MQVHEPGSSAAELVNGPGGFDRQRFMGTWGVRWSTLPMWKLAGWREDSLTPDVNITYTPTSSSHDSFDSVVEYRKAGSSKTSTVKGTETLTPGTNGATFDWRGKGWLFFVTSHWEILGYGVEDGVEWAVSYFSKTLFTPAGLDIYVRQREAGGVGAEGVIAKVVEAVQRVQGVKELAKTGFSVAGS